MIGEIFYWVLNMSILGTLMGFIVLILRRIKWLPSFVTYLLWIVPLVRLWIPFGFGSKYSLMSLISRVTTKTVTLYEFGEGSPLPELVMTNGMMAASDYFPVVYKTNLLEKLFSVASVIWIVGSISALIAVCMLYVMTSAEMKNACRVKDNVYTSDKLLSPAIFGVFKPRIILPQSMSESDARYAVMHEKVHVRRADNFRRIIAVITACIHWFNPFMWLFMKRFFEDMELSCDEKVLKECGEDKKKEYASALLNCEKQKTVFASAFGGAKIKVRIENILSYKKLSFFSALCFILLAVAITVTLLTNAG